MLYDIRDAFRNLLQAISVPEASESLSERATLLRKDRIPRLSSLCAAVLGEYVEEQVDLAKAERKDEDASVNDDLDVMYNFYEIVPSHHRRYVRSFSYDAPLCVHAVITDPWLSRTPSPLYSQHVLQTIHSITYF